MTEETDIKIMGTVPKTSDPIRPMLCPLCRCALYRLPKKKYYETLNDHVSNPNGDSPARYAYTCIDPACEASKDKVFWAEDGEGPYTRDWKKEYAWIDHNPNPFNSRHRPCYFQGSYKEEDSSRTIFNKIRIDTKVRYESDEYGHKSKRRVSYDILVRSKKFHGAFVHYTNGLHMLIFELRRFYAARGTGWSRSHDVVDRAYWPKAEWWRKAASWYLRTFYKKDVLADREKADYVRKNHIFGNWRDVRTDTLEGGSP